MSLALKYKAISVYNLPMNVIKHSPNLNLESEGALNLLNHISEVGSIEGYFCLHDN